MIFGSKFAPLYEREKYLNLSIPNSFTKKLNSNTEEEVHMNIHLPISTKINIGINANNWKHRTALLAS